MKAAFNLLLQLHSRPMVLKRRGTALTADVKAAPSNYFRNLEVVNKVTSEGREFVISKEYLSTFGEPKKGDALEDPELGVMIISEVITMFVIGAEIVGYRLRIG